MFRKKESPEEKLKRESSDYWRVENGRLIEEILDNLGNVPVDYDQITNGFMIGYKNAKVVFEKAIAQTQEDNRRLKNENLVLKIDNENLAKKVAAFEASLNGNEVSDGNIDEDGKNGTDSDNLAYYELIP